MEREAGIGLRDLCVLPLRISRPGQSGVAESFNDEETQLQSCDQTNGSGLIPAPDNDVAMHDTALEHFRIRVMKLESG